MRMTPAQIDVLLNEDRPRVGWRRSAAGNLTRGHPTGARLTVFYRAGGYRWCLAAPGERPRFSPGWFETEAEACAAVWRVADGTDGEG